MKSGSVGKRRRTAYFGLAALLMAAVASGCGKPSDDEAAGSSSGRLPVIGDTAFGSQCPYGSQSELKPAKLALWDCPVQGTRAELSQPPKSLLFQADCKKKLLIVRSSDRTIDTMWEVMPDGSFYVTIDGGPVSFRSPVNCTAYTSLDLFGNLNCSDRDKVNIDVNALWWVSKGNRPADAAAPNCNLPASCYLATEQTVKQCQ